MRTLNTVLLCLGLGFLGFLIWKVGPGELWHEVNALGWGVSLLILTEGLANLAHTAGWRRCIPGPRKRFTLARLYLMASAGYAINYLTPTASVGGDVSRAALLASRHTGPEAVSSVLLDKLLTAVAHLVLVIVGALFLLWRITLPTALWMTMAVATALLAGGMSVFLVLQIKGKLGLFCQWLVNRRFGGKTLRKAAEQLAKVDSTLRESYRTRRTSIVVSVLWHIAGHSAAIIQAWLFLRLLHQPAPLAMVAAAGILSLWFDLLTFLVPMNLGTLEGSRLLVFKTLGCEALLGVAFGVSLRIAQLFWACFGLVSYSLLVKGRPSESVGPLQSADERARVGCNEAPG